MFYGIIISMFYEIQAKHHLPHIHARYQDHKASIAIEDGGLPVDCPQNSLEWFKSGWICTMMS